MPTAFANFIDGEWVARSRTVAHVNPSDLSDVIGHFAQADNLPTAGTDYHVPFGGRKHSSHGPRERGRAAAEFYTVVKTSYINAGRAA